ncbi:MAG: M50 family metallopeptidase [Longimicrobiales bacterium]|nr:M50 family metallopeptidase [Longimicrobiales bacterium]
MKPRTRRQLRLGGAFLLYFALLWYFWYTPVVYPLKIFVVLLHEASHALAIWATGGEVVSITLNPMQGGATWGRGGIPFVTLSAGYLGSLGLGALLVMGAHTRRVSPRWLLGGVGGVVLALTLVYVRSGFGFGFGLLFGFALVVAARYLPAAWSRATVVGLGLTSVLYAILDIKSDILDRPELRSDAAMLAELTGVPTQLWGVVWIAAALAAAWWLLRWTLDRA